MRFQFSILTMLACTAAMAVVVAASLRIPVYEFEYSISDGITHTGGEPHLIAVYRIREPGAVDLLWRLAWAGPLAVFISLCLLWACRLFMRAFEPVSR